MRIIQSLTAMQKCSHIYTIYLYYQYLLWMISCVYLCAVSCCSWSLSFSIVSHKHFYLAVTGLSCPGYGPCPGLCTLLAAGLHHSCIQDECSHAEHCSAHGTRGCSDTHTRKGTGTFCEMTEMVCKCQNKEEKHFFPFLSLTGHACRKHQPQVF